MPTAADRSPDPAPDRFRRLDLAGLGAGIALVLAVGIRANSSRSLRLDEAFSLETSATVHSLKHVVRQALWFEEQPPLYFTLLHFWFRIADNPAFARLLSTLFVAGAVIIVWRIARDLELRGPWVSLPFLVACCPYVLWAASDARSYALTLLLSAATTWCFCRLWIVDRPPPRGLFAGYVVLTLLSLLNFYYTGFLFAAQLLAAWLSGRRRKEALVAAGIIALLLLPALPVIHRQFAMHITGSFPVSENATALGRALDLTWRMVGTFFDTLLQTDGRFRPLLEIALLCLVTMLVLSRVQKGKVRWPHEASLLALTGLLPFLVLEILDMTSFALVSGRHRGIIVIPLLTASALAADRLPTGRLRVVLGLLLSGTVAWFGLDSVRTDQPMQDYKSAAEYVAKRTTPGEPIFFFDNVGVLAFRYYYHQPNPMLGLPRDYTFDNWSNANRALADSAQLRHRIEAVVPEGGAYWIVERKRMGREVRPEVLETYRKTEAQSLDSVRVAGLAVYHLRN